MDGQPERRVCRVGDQAGQTSGTGEGSIRYYTNVGPVQGPAFDRRVPPTIDVLEAPDDAEPIGTALCLGVGAQGFAIWGLIVQRVEVPGRWVLIDREFRRPESTQKEGSGDS
jgi:hypothetical protein